MSVVTKTKTNKTAEAKISDTLFFLQIFHRFTRLNETVHPFLVDQQLAKVSVISGLVKK